MLSSARDICIPRCLQARAEQAPGAIAIAAPGGAPTYAELFAQLNYCVGILNSLGIGHNDRVAIVLPNGPAMITTLLGVMSCATAAPLNPAYTASEFDFFLSDLNAKALLIQSGYASPAREVAQERGIAIIELSHTSRRESGSFELSGGRCGESVTTGYSRYDDVALVLHTSGTTSRPKIVPLTQANVLTSANHIKSALALTARDRYLGVMPLFHIHGLMVALSSLLAGGSVCSIDFETERFFRGVNEFSPNWYSAVPTIHQAILRAIASRQDVVARSRLRFVRSSSAALPIRVKEELERAFNVPVIEAYGMTEAAHQMASDPLPPRARKPGSVGVAAGPKVAIMDEAGKLLSPGQIGEIVIRGANVFQGYENNQAANAAAFTDGWFRTGDQGYLDSEGYLFICGRLKDIINRGGAKIAPAEIDKVLLSHPAIEQAVAFPVAHPTLGEDVAAAVVLQRDASVTEEEIRKFTADRVAGFKVPQRVLILTEIPKGPTGKVQRRALAEKIGHAATDGSWARATPDYVAPVKTVEHQLVQIWEELFPVRPIGIHDSFFELGGDSLLAAQMMLRVEQVVGIQAPPALLLVNPTIAHLVKALGTQRYKDDQSLVATIQSGNGQRPLFFLNGNPYREGSFISVLTHALGEGRPFYGLRPHGFDGGAVPKTVEAMAASYIETIRSVNLESPALLGGYCSGGVVAFEMARQLQEEGRKVDQVILVAASGLNSRYRFLQRVVNGLGSLNGLALDQRSEMFQRWRSQALFCERLGQYYLGRIGQIVELPLAAQIGWVTGLFHRKFLHGIPDHLTSRLSVQQSEPRNPVEQAPHSAVEAYVPKRYRGRVTLLWPHEDLGGGCKDPTQGWQRVARQIEVRTVPGGHETCISKYASDLADHIKACLDRLDNG